MPPISNVLIYENDVESNDDVWEANSARDDSISKKDKTRSKLLEMGMDPSLLDQDPDLVEALLESMMAEEQIARE